MSKPAPTVAIVAASGYVGKFVTKEFLAALKESRFKQVRLLASKPSEAVQEFEKQGAQLFIVDYSKPKSVIDALIGVDVVVSTLGTGPGTDETKDVLLNSMVFAGVKIYFPSEFGTNHYNRVKHYNHEMFDGKKKHFKEAKAKGLTVVGIICSLIMEGTFGTWFGIDTKADIWTLVGKGETPLVLTAERDIGRFTVEAVIKAYNDPKKIPDLIEVSGDCKTMKEYAEGFDKVAGRPTKFELVSLDKALAHYEATGHDFLYLLQILLEEGAFNYGSAKGNQLLNPGETVWKLKKFEELAQETGGRP